MRNLLMLLVGVAVVMAGCESNDAGFDDSSRPARESRSFEMSFGASPISVIDTTPEPTDPKVQLGKKLFHDTRLSGDDTIACASCHVIRDGGDDGRQVAIGIRGATGELNTPTVLNSSLNVAQFWDGRAATLADQALGPIHNPKEMDSNIAAVVDRLNADPAMVDLFRDAFGEMPDAENIIAAIVAYEEALVTPDAPFDRFLIGDSSALTAEARQGYKDFVELGCVSCHQGRNVGGNMFQYFGVMGNYFEERGGEIRTVDLGRYNVTGRDDDKFKFKVPSLRNVAHTAPYFHDGSAETLEEAVSIMARYQLGRQIDDTQLSHLTAFLKSLTGRVPAELHE